METPNKNAKKVRVISIFSYQAPLGESVSDLSDTIPGQAFSIGELLDRATRGQRLNVKQFPSNLVQDLGDQPDDHFRQQGDEDFDMAPPDISDRVELDEFVEAHKERKRQFTEKLAQKKKDKDAAEQAKRSEKKDADAETTD